MKSKTISKIKYSLIALMAVCFMFSAILMIGTTKTKVNASSPATTNLTMEQGASIRMSNPSGIRFTAKLNDEFFFEQGELNFELLHPVGMIIVPAQTIDGLYVGGNWTKDVFEHLKTEHGKNPADVSATFDYDGVAFVKGEYYVTGAITNIKESHYTWDYVAVAYYEDGGVNYYSAPSAPRSIAYVAHAALHDGKSGLSDAQKADLRAICNKSAGYGLTHHAAVPAGVNDGNIEYWTCDKCGKYYSDKDGLTEITKEGTVAKLAFSADNPASYITTGVPYSYNAELKCYETNYGIDYDWRSPKSIVVIKKEYLDYLRAEKYDLLKLRLVNSDSSIKTGKVAIAKSDKNATEIGDWGATEGTYQVELNNLPNDAEIVNANGDLTFKFFADIRAPLQLTLTPSKPSEADKYLSYVETGSPFTYNETEKCYMRDYSQAEKWGDSTIFKIKKEYLDELRAKGATKLMMRALGPQNMDIAKPDPGASGYAARGLIAILKNPIDLTNMPVGDGVVDEKGNLAFKIYASHPTASNVSGTIRVYISTDIDDKYNDFSTFDATNPATFVKARDPFEYNSTDKNYFSFAKNYQKTGPVYESEFRIVKEYVDYLKSQNITNLQVTLKGDGGTSFIETSGMKTLKKAMGEPAVYVIDLSSLDGSDLLDENGNIFLRVCTNADSILRVTLTPQ